MTLSAGRRETGRASERFSGKFQSIGSSVLIVALAMIIFIVTLAMIIIIAALAMIIFATGVAPMDLDLATFNLTRGAVAG
jgi:hypothetical protein